MLVNRVPFYRSISSAVLAWSSKLMVDHDSTGPVSIVCLRPTFEFSFKKAIALVQTSRNVDINSNGHISVLLEATVKWSSTLVVLYVLRILL